MRLLTTKGNAWYMILSLLLIATSQAKLPNIHTDYYAVLLDKRKIGYAEEKRVVAGEQVRTTNTIKLTITRMGIPLNVQQTETHIETLDGKPIRFESIQDMSIMRIHIQGTVSDGVLKVTTTSAGAPQQTEMPWPKGAVLAEGLRLATLKYDLTPGTQFEVPTFQPSLMQAVTLSIKVGREQDVDLLGRVVRLTEVQSRYLAPTGEMNSTSYVNKDLRPEKTVMSMMGFDIEMVACAKEFALSEAESVDLMDRMLIESPKKLKDLHRYKAVTYVLRPSQTDTAFAIPENDQQTVKKASNGTLRVTVRRNPELKGGSFPYKGQDPQLLDALKSSAYLQIDQPEIKALAEKAVNGASDTAEAVQKIEAFVADYIDNKDLSVGYATAAEVYQSRQGDCTEHAVLCAALCRAVGIPAQVVVGIAYVEEFVGRRHVFGGHAWNQAYVGDRWIGLDAAFKGTGRQGFEPGHIALAMGNGEPGDFFGMMGSLGQFTMEAIEVER